MAHHSVHRAGPSGTVQTGAQAGRYSSQHKSRDKTWRGQEIKKETLETLPSLDQAGYYDLPSPASSSAYDSDASIPPPRYNIQTNSGNKLELSARWSRRGKLYAWGPSYDETRSEYRVRTRLKRCLEQFLPDAAADVGTSAPQNILDAAEKRRDRKRRKAEEQEYILPHLRSPSPPMSTTRLAPLLALPQSYTDVMLSPSMRHTLGDDTVETGLQRTAAELLEGEKGLMQALGRLKEVLRVRGRDVPNADGEAPIANGDVVANGHAEDEVVQADSTGAAGAAGAAVASAADGTVSPAPKDGTGTGGRIPPLPHISDTDNLWRVTQELLQVNPLQLSHSLPLPPAPPHPHLPNPDAHARAPSLHLAVDDALERVAELLADCNEYKERLEEARDRVADVARARKKVWSVIKERAGLELDRAEGK
ncbi:hypothetical protein EHS25_005142 [Saitozyma podzolica]|uniref:Transcriptional regulatory protein RXT2 N-terminal domain-containing protein n=1 Tax=Saitozyma podzolica TaxID=1890683 RepID=A0A427XYD9_9TREE|nr:hypothetical protein EHS25_005142 [Saitozyma podzolica]